MTQNIQIGILSADQETSEYLAKAWGKKGTSSDITIYTTKNPQFLQTTIIPNGFPKKIIPLVITAHMSDSVVLGVNSTGLDKNIGEMALLADCLNLDGLYSVIGENTNGYEMYLEQMKKVFTKLSLSKWDSMMINGSDSFIAAREKLYSKFNQHRGNPNNYLAIDVDHAFPVQGVGSVILGTITSGIVEKGQKIIAYPSGQSGQVRSIQVNDEEVKSALVGSHVGLALKGILPKYLKRGTVIASPSEDGVKEIDQIDNIKINKAGFGNQPIVDQKIHVVAGLYDSPGTILDWNGSATIQLDKPIPFYPDIRCTILDLNTKPAVLASKA